MRNPCSVRRGGWKRIQSTEKYAKKEIYNSGLSKHITKKIQTKYDSNIGKNQSSVKIQIPDDDDNDDDEVRERVRDRERERERERGR